MRGYANRVITIPSPALTWDLDSLCPQPETDEFAQRVGDFGDGFPDRYRALEGNVARYTELAGQW